MKADKKLLPEDQIKKMYEDLVKDTGITAQKRGYDFEKLIYSLLFYQNLEPKASYQVPGEQVDGSFFWEGQTFLLEANG